LLSLERCAILTLVGYASNKANRQVAPLTEELIAEGLTIKCTKCHAWVVAKNERRGTYITGKYATGMEMLTGATPVCSTCKGRGYISPEHREHIRDWNGVKNRRNALIDIVKRGIDENVGADHDDYKVLRERELMRFVGIALHAEGLGPAVKDDGHALRVLIERTGWDFLAWLREEAK